MLIPRKIFETYRDAFPSLHYRDDQQKDDRVSFFDVGVIKETPTRNRYYSEDYLFCRRVRQLGFSVYVDTNIELGHHGWIRYPLSDDDLVRAIASRAVSPEKLQGFLQDIDRAAKARWIQPLPQSSQQPLEHYKA